MGLLSKIGLAVPVTIGNVITKGLSKITGKEYGTTTIKEASETTFGKVLGTAITGTAAALAGTAISASSTATAAVIKLIPATTKGKVIAAVAAPVAIGAITEKPKETTKAIISLPSNLANVGANIADLATNPSLSNATDLIKENPVIVGGAIAATGVAAAAVLSNTIQGSLTRSQIAEQTEVFQEQADIMKQGLTGNVSTLPTTTNQVQTIPATTGTSSAATAPVLPQTQTLTATTGSTSTKRKKSSRKPLQSKISQSVKLNIINTSSANRITKKYINMIPLRN